MRTAALFPGQGSQTPDMGDAVERLRPDLYELAVSELGDDLFDRVDETTALAQPAIYCASLAGWSRSDLGSTEVMAGHSLGEFAALAAAGAVDEADGLRLVALRGRLMQHAAEDHGSGGMLAVRAETERAAELAESFGLTVANDNAPDQVVLSGPADAIARAAEQAKGDGIRARPLPVAGAFHSPAMEPAAADFKRALDATEFAAPRVPVFSCVTAAPFGEDVRPQLADGVRHPVRWRETLLELQRLGIERFVEVGPGKVLTGLVRRTLPDRRPRLSITWKRPPMSELTAHALPLNYEARRAPAIGAAVGSVAMAVPSTVVSNRPIEERLGVDPGWIAERTGVRERHVLHREGRLSDLAADAGALALERAELDAGELDMLLVATTTQDELTPNAAPLVAERLGAPHAAAIDVGAACTAFLSALALATGQVESGRIEKALVIGADILWRFLDPDDRRTAGLFGDGAGAVVVTAADDARIGPVVMASDGAHAELIQARRGGTISMQGHETYVNAVKRMSQVTEQALRLSGLTLDEIDLFVYHQANSRILRAVGERLGLPPERVVDCVDRYANTSAASIPIALAEAEAEGRLFDCARVLLAAFGAGFTWGGTVVIWGDSA